MEAALPTRPKANNDSSTGSTDVINILCEILLDGLRMKTKMAPLTVSSLIEVR